MEAFLKPFKFFLYFLHSDSKRSPTMVKQDSYIQLLDTLSSFDTKDFLKGIKNVAMTYPGDPKVVINRMLVRSLTHCKDSQSPEHEFIVVDIEDQELRGQDSKPLLVYLERNTSDRRKESKRLDSTQALKTLKKLPFSSNPHPYQAIPSTTDEPTATSSSSPLTSKSILKSFESVSDTNYADDRFIGFRNSDLYLKASRNLRQISPEGFSLFDLAVLADVVHEQAPLYTLLHEQCFWFSMLICDIIESEYSCKTVSSAEHGSFPNNYLPNLEGKWNGITINSSEPADVIRTAASKFQIQLKEETEEVSFTFNLNMNALANLDAGNFCME
jgi:hypothetical protein